MASASAATYKVKSGDTLGQIAANHNVLLSEVIAANPHIENPSLIYPNDLIEIGGSASVQATQQYAVNKAAATQEPVQRTQTSGKISLGESEIALLSRLIRAEANDEPYEGKVAVGNVVLARMLHDEFPNTLQGVIYARNQFSVVNNGSINKAATNESINAAYEAVKRTNQGNNDMSLYFYNPSIVKQSWLQTRTHVKTIGSHAFKK